MENTTKPIAPILKNMNIGDRESYPMRKFTSVTTTIGRIQRETDKRYSYRTVDGKDGSYIEVTRVS